MTDAPGTQSKTVTDSFWRDGVVKLPALVDVAEIESLRHVIDRELEIRKAKQFVFQQDGQGRFLGSQDMWRNDPVCRTLCLSSHLPGAAGALLDSTRITLFFDHLFVKEPGTSIGTSWHNDLPYWPVKGRKIVSMWVAVDDVDEENGALTFAIGSHRWDRDLQPTTFAGRSADDPRQDLVAGLGPGSIAEEDIELRTFCMSAGDVLAFHSTTMHCAGANRSSERVRRGYVIRYTGDDVMYDPRPGVHKMMLEKGLSPGGPIDCSRYPTVWNA